ncbi:aspartate/glutamate racemase family protein [Flavonifractor plautii]|nr:aspartate/glutamate racemase family protein [Flavonifractor plautii]
MSEQRLGILGGMGPQATQDFYQRILDRTDASCDQEHLPTLIWSDTSMPDRTAAILGGDAEGCYRRLLDGARLLERGGCTALAIPCNTSHYFADRLQGISPSPHPHAPGDRGRAGGGREKAGGYPGHRRHGSDRHLPEGVRRPGHGRRDAPADVQKLVMSIIYDEIKRGEKGSREKFAAIDRWLRASGCDAAILGCTELSVYRTYHGLPDYYLDAMEILAERCITACGYRLRMV